jgi:hypothetical protein
MFRYLWIYFTKSPAEQIRQLREQLTEAKRLLIEAKDIAREAQEDLDRIISRLSQPCESDSWDQPKPEESENGKEG